MKKMVQYLVQLVFVVHFSMLNELVICDKQMSHLRPKVAICMLELISGDESGGYT